MNWTGWIIGGLFALYGLHRFALWLEAHGHLYYLNKSSSGSAAGAFVAMQRAIEPRSQQVELVRHVEQRVEEDEAMGRDDSHTAG